MNILIVDDEFQSCKLLAEKVRSFELEEIEKIWCAASGEEALKILRQKKCQLLISDICMSPMDGLELVAKAKARNPELICILLSAFDEFAYAQRGIKLGIRDYWLKPCSADHMRESLMEIIREYRSNQDSSRMLLDTIIHGAVTLGDKSLDDVFHSTAHYPGNGGYMVVWDSSIAQEFSIPGFWICRLLDGKSLFACPETCTPESAVQLERALTQTGIACGVSALGGNVAQMWRQAQLALSVQWVWGEHKAIFFEDIRPIAGQIEEMVKDSLNKIATVNPDNRRDILAWLEERKAGMTAFAFAVYIDRVYSGLLKQIAELSGKPIHEGKTRSLGWKKAFADALRELISTKIRQIDLRKRDPIQWSVEYVAQHLGDSDLDMALLADKLGISYPYFSELFHKQLGKTFSEYILDVRMKEACRSLLQGELVADVSKKVGYQDYHSFIRAFKRLYGISPTAFRNMKG